MFDLSAQELVAGLAFWGYPTMFLLMILEGPVTTIVAAFLASLGFFDIMAVFGLSVLGDVIGDVVLYYIGFFGGKGLLEKKNNIFKLTPKRLRSMCRLFENNGAKIVFSVKITTGLSYLAFISAGVAKMSFWKFLRYSILGGLVWSGAVVLIGFFFGSAAATIDKYISYSGWIVFALAIVTILAISFKRKKKIFNKK